MMCNTREFRFVASIVALVGLVAVPNADAQGNVFVANKATDDITKFDLAGNHVATFNFADINSLNSIVLGPDNLLYASGNSSGASAVVRFDQDGNVVPFSSAGNAISTSFRAFYTAFDSSDRLLVGDGTGAAIYRFDKDTGNALDGGSSFISGLGFISSLRGTDDGRLFVGTASSGSAGEVHIYNDNTSALVDSFDTTGPLKGGADYVIFGPDFNNDSTDDIYASSANDSLVAVFSGTDYAVLDSDLLSGSPSFHFGLGLLPGGDLLAVDRNGSRVERFEFAGNTLTQFGEATSASPAFLDGPNAMAVVGSESTPPPTSFTWNRTATGEWNSALSWTPTSGPPNGNADAIFGDKIQQDSTVVVDSPVTVRRIELDNANSYIIAGASSVNLATGTDAAGDVPPVVSVLQGPHEFQVRVNLNADTEVNVAPPSALLEFNNRLNLNGHTLTKTGAGTLFINNRLTTGVAGSIDCQAGTCGGTGSIGGDLLNDGAIISPGSIADSVGTLAVIPEPASLALLGLGLLGWVTSRWSRRIHRELLLTVCPRPCGPCLPRCSSRPMCSGPATNHTVW